MADEDVAVATKYAPSKKTGRKAGKKATKKSAASRSGAASGGPVTKSELPYVLTTARIPDLFSKIQSAAVPQRVTFQFLRHLGFTSSNDRAFTSLLRKLGFTDANGVPSDRYREFKNPADAPRALADGIRELYADLFAVNEQIHDRDVGTVRGVVSRVTGIDARRAGLIARTFRALADLADFEGAGGLPRPSAQAAPGPEPVAPRLSPLAAPETELQPRVRAEPHHAEALPVFRHNIEIHLPATTDVAVYNAIFRSLREHLAD